MAKNPSKVNVKITASTESDDAHERCLARILKEGLYIDTLKLKKLKGGALAQYLILKGASELDPGLVQEISSAQPVEAQPTAEVSRAGANVSAAPARSEGPSAASIDEEKRRKLSALGLTDYHAR